MSEGMRISNQEFNAAVADFQQALGLRRKHRLAAGEGRFRCRRIQFATEGFVSGVPDWRRAKLVLEVELARSPRPITKLVGGRALGQLSGR